MPSPLDDVFPRPLVDIVGRDGVVKATTKASIGEKRIGIADTSIVIEVGDEIRRKVPNGTEEVFLVTDTQFKEEFGPFPAEIGVRFMKKGAVKAGTGGSYFNLVGAGARVNIGSHDQSVNIHSKGDVFADLRSAITGRIQGSETKVILAALEELNIRKGKPGFAAAYQKFIASVGRHVDVIAPFLPALGAMFA